MKRILLALLLAFSTVLVSCSDDATGPEGSDMTFTIDGQSWSAGAISSSGDLPNMLITGSTVNTTPLESLFFDLTGIEEGATIKLNGDNFGNSAEFRVGTDKWTTLNDPTGDGSGTVTITKVTDDRIEGTFECTVYEDPEDANSASRVITNGKFSAPNY